MAIPQSIGSRAALVTKTVVIGDTQHLGHHELVNSKKSLQTFKMGELSTENILALEDAAFRIRTSKIPVAFPTETVYGLGADATRSCAVQGIYEAKGRPSDNPLIIHVCDLDMLRSLLKDNDAPLYQESGTKKTSAALNCVPVESSDVEDPIPEIYRTLIHKFWPGPLTILLPNGPQTGLAPEVTAGLDTFAVRMPDMDLALTLIKLAGVPIAAPSANASTKPSPTLAEHVYHDLKGKIEIILDGGACNIGVESTVVDGLCQPPVILRPGGLSMDDIRKVPGWENVVEGYKDTSEVGKVVPRAPGMKYKHYSPKATVILCEKGAIPTPTTIPGIFVRPGGEKSTDYSISSNGSLEGTLSSRDITVGIIRTRFWKPFAGWDGGGRMNIQDSKTTSLDVDLEPIFINESGTANFTSADKFTKDNKDYVDVAPAMPGLKLAKWMGKMDFGQPSATYSATIWDISLGKGIGGIAYGLFAALRELDGRGVGAIFVEGIEGDSDITAAVMNRLRKAATVHILPEA